MNVLFQFLKPCRLNKKQMTWNAYKKGAFSVVLAALSYKQTFLATPDLQSSAHPGRMVSQRNSSHYLVPSFHCSSQRNFSHAKTLFDVKDWEPGIILFRINASGLSPFKSILFESYIILLCLILVSFFFYFFFIFLSMENSITFSKLIGVLHCIIMSTSLSQNVRNLASRCDLYISKVPSFHIFS